MPAPHLSLTEWAVLAVLAEAPAHGFALARELAPGSGVGRVLTVRRPLVYRALDRLVEAGLAVPVRTEPGDAGPNRTVHRVTPTARRLVRRWLDTPAAHVRDLRIELLVKLVLTERAGRPVAPLVVAQRSALRPTFDALAELPPDADVVTRWRHHATRGAAAFLDDLAGD